MVGSGGCDLLCEYAGAINHGTMEPWNQRCKPHGGEELVHASSELAWVPTANSRQAVSNALAVEAMLQPTAVSFVERSQTAKEQPRQSIQVRHLLEQPDPLQLLERDSY